MDQREMMAPEWRNLVADKSAAPLSAGDKQKRLRPCFYSPIQCLIKRGEETAEQPAH